MKLDLSYIRKQMKARGVLPVYELAILDYLNSVKTAEELAGDEPRPGPIWDDPARGFAQGTRGYDIGPKVAQRILDKRDALGGFTSIEQLEGIPYFGVDKFEDLLYSFLTHSVPVPTGLGQDFDTFILAVGGLEMDAKRRGMSNRAALAAIRKVIFADTMPGQDPPVFNWDDVFTDTADVEVVGPWGYLEELVAYVRTIREKNVVKVQGRPVAMNYVIAGIEATLQQGETRRVLGNGPE
ncbi:MAG: helix-hairpin-helix domain-containing protein, partial [Bacteroidota bacterium]